MAASSGEQVYLAVIGDIRGSRDLEHRARIQERFRGVIDGLNDRFGGSVASPFTITTGDEFQGLVTSASAAVGSVVEATEQMHPHKLRFGVGVGPLETPLNEEQAIGMDGPCFHNARAALEQAGDDGTWVRLRGFGDAVDQRFGALFDLVAAVREGWTSRQREFAYALREEPTQRRVAERFGVSPSTVSESLTSGHVHEVHAAEEALEGLLADRFRRTGEVAGA